MMSNSMTCMNSDIYVWSKFLFKIQIKLNCLSQVGSFTGAHYISPFYALKRHYGKISAQSHPTLCIQFLDRENNDKNDTLPLGKQICFIIVWGCAEILPALTVSQIN